MGSKLPVETKGCNLVTRLTHVGSWFTFMGQSSAANYFHSFGSLGSFVSFGRVNKKEYQKRPKEQRNRRFEGGARFTLSTSRISVSCCLLSVGYQLSRNQPSTGNSCEKCKPNLAFLVYTSSSIYLTYGWNERSSRCQVFTFH